MSRQGDMISCARDEGYARGYADGKQSASKHGFWTEAAWQNHVPGYDDRCWVCSKCGREQSYGEADYCPNCGAKMDAQEITKC